MLPRRNGTERPLPGSPTGPDHGRFGSVAATLSGQLSAFRLARRMEAHFELLTVDAVVDPLARSLIHSPSEMVAV
jgi:hypothetical protein